MRLILALLLLFGPSACSFGRESPTAAPTRQPTSSPAAPDSAAPTQPDASDTKACEEVRAGIEAFNAGECERTVEHFRLALPLAREEFRTDLSQAADDLVDAVTYYAELAPEEYPEPLQGSSESPGVTA